MTEHRFHFISGLPRSGSTLLGAILRQNPRFSAGMSSPVANLFEGIVNQVSAGTELSRIVDQSQRERLLRGLFNNYYADNPAEVIFDTSRKWTAKIPELIALFPQAKFICCVRNVAWIMDSLERQYRSKTFENTALFPNPGDRATVYSRTESLAAPNRLVGFAYQALREACWGELADRMVILDYDMLAQRPADVLRLLYDFVGEPQFAHDFGTIDYDAPEFDELIGISGMHRVRSKVEFQPRKSILPPDVFSKYSGLSFWQDLQNCEAYRIVQQPNTANPSAQSAHNP